MPSGQLLDECVDIITEIKQKTSNIIFDTDGQTLKKIVEEEQLLLISPNVQELGELLGEQIDDNSEAIIRCAEKICANVEMVLVSRGGKGAILITKDRAFEGKVISDKDKSIHTVGCGDYLLAGFLAGLKKGNIREALIQGIKAATARAWGWCEKMNWLEAESKIEVDVRPFNGEMKK
jgi:fructose-1-phosphate kinase PfkB-like protein